MNSRIYHASWCGLFAHPILDRDIFEELPYVRQCEILCSMYGGVLPDFDAIPPVPSWFLFHIPDSIPLTSLLRHRVELKALKPMTQDQYEQILAALQKRITLYEFVSHCTSQGKGERFRQAKPGDGVFAYMWRMGHFYSCAANRVSWEALWELEEGIISLTGIWVHLDLKNEYHKALISFVNDQAKMHTSGMGLRSELGTLRFGRSQGLGI